MKVRVMLAAALFAVGLTALSSVQPLVRSSFSADYSSFYYASRAAEGNQNMYDGAVLSKIARDDGFESRVYPYLYPPFLAAVLRPIAGISRQSSHRIWLAILVFSTAFVGLFCAVVGNIVYCPRRASWTVQGDSFVPASFALIAICVLCLPFQNSLGMGQANTLVLAFVLLSLTAYFLGHTAIAGAILAPAVMIKCTPGLLLLFFVARRSFRTVLGFCVGTIVLWAFSLVWVDLDSWEEYFSFLSGVGYGKNIPYLFSASAVYNFSPAGYWARILPNAQGAVNCIATVTTLLMSGVAAIASYRARGAIQEALAAALFFPAVILGSPIAYVHHIIFLLPATAVWLSWAWRESRFGFFSAFLLLTSAAGQDWPRYYEKLKGPFSNDCFRAVNLFCVLALFFLGITAFLLARRESRETTVSRGAGYLTANSK